MERSKKDRLVDNELLRLVERKRERVCVCVRERERERERDKEIEKRD